MCESAVDLSEFEKRACQKAVEFFEDCWDGARIENCNKNDCKQ